MLGAYSVPRWTTLATFCWLWSSSHSSHLQHQMPEWWLCHQYCTKMPIHSTPPTCRVKWTMAEWSSTVTANYTMYVRKCAGHVCNVDPVRCACWFQQLSYLSLCTVQILMGAALQRRVEGKGIVVSALHPGMVSVCTCMQYNWIPIQPNASCWDINTWTFSSNPFTYLWTHMDDIMGLSQCMVGYIISPILRIHGESSPALFSPSLLLPI